MASDAPECLCQIEEESSEEFGEPLYGWMDQALSDDEQNEKPEEDANMKIIDNLEKDIQRLTMISKKIETEIETKQRQIFDAAYPEKPDQEK